MLRGQGQEPAPFAVGPSAGAGAAQEREGESAKEHEKRGAPGTRRPAHEEAEAERKRFYLSDLRYRNGVASYLDLLDAQRSLFALEQADVQVRLAQQLNQINLYKALGGGWSEASLGKQEVTNR